MFKNDWSIKRCFIVINCYLTWFYHKQDNVFLISFWWSSVGRKRSCWRQRRQNCNMLSSFWAQFFLPIARLKYMRRFLNKINVFFDSPNAASPLYHRLSSLAVTSAFYQAVCRWTNWVLHAYVFHRRTVALRQFLLLDCIHILYRPKSTTAISYSTTGDF